jgi:predicted anti-sigma-YlaC factor YlaD
MKQNHIYQHIILEISDAESENHLRECSSCRTLYSKVDETMSLLDVDVEIPEGMAAGILSENTTAEVPLRNKLSFSSYIQISLVIVAGIFLGFILGKNADTSVFQSNNSKLHHSLIEFREVHHLNVDESTFSI